MTSSSSNPRGAFDTAAPAPSRPPSSNERGARNPLLEELRQHTRDAHHALDTGLAIGSEALDRGAYVSFLRAVASVLADLEPGVARFLGPPRVARVPCLAADLHDLGAAVPSPSPVPLPRDEVEAFGAAYVIEGSALGGAVLARRVADVLGDEVPRRYLLLHGPNTGAHWRAFCDALAGFDERIDIPSRERMCLFARDVFAAYRAAAESLGATAGRSR